MPLDRALQTHIAFRSTYNIYYEAVRPNNNNPTFAKDSDAYNVTATYHKECSSTIMRLCKAKRKTYGVRDEYRVSGQGAQVLLREIIPREWKHVLTSITLAEHLFRPGNIWHLTLSLGFPPTSGSTFLLEGWRKYKEPRFS